MGTGYRNATGADKPIKHNNVKVGFWKALVFYDGKLPKGDKTNRIMHEFRVNELQDQNACIWHEDNIKLLPQIIVGYEFN